jgi:hypothetical protein
MKIKGKQLDDNTIFQNNLSLTTPVFNTDAATKEYVDLLSSTEYINVSNKGMAAISTSGITGATIACNTSISETPTTGCYIMVLINKLQVDVGIGKECFFSNDGGVTARVSGEEQLGDFLYWNTNIAPYDLEITDEIDFIYIKSESAISGTTNTETISRTIYVSPTGNDGTGDGSISLPFATPLRAFMNIKEVIGENIDITINFASGIYTWDCAAIREETRKKYISKAAGIIINGTSVTDVSGLTITTVGGDTPYIYNVTGATFTTNQYQDYFISDEAIWYPIVKNGTTTINSNIAAAGHTLITHNGVTFNLTDTDMGIMSKCHSTGSVTLNITNVNLISTVTVRLVFGGVINLYFSKIVGGFVTFPFETGRLNIRGCVIATSAGGIISNNSLQIRHTSIRKTGSKAGQGLTLCRLNEKTNFLSAYGVYISNFAVGIYFDADGGANDMNQGSGSLILDNCTDGFGIRNNCFIHFSAVESKVYIIGVTNLINRAASNQTMLCNYGVTIQDLYGTPTNWATSYITANGYNNPGRNIAINIEGLYGEFEYNKTATLANNSSGTTVIGSTTQNKSIFIKYTITRGTTQEQGTIWVNNKNDVDISIKSEFDDCGVTFGKQISSTAINLTWVTTNTGTAATFRYDIDRIMI